MKLFFTLNFHSELWYSIVVEFFQLIDAKKSFTTQMNATAQRHSWMSMSKLALFNGRILALSSWFFSTTNFSETLQPR